MIKQLVFFLISTLSFNIFAQCDNNTTNKIMILGDSWAFFSWQGDSYNENLDRFGFTDIRAKSNGDISVNGTTANNFFTDNTRRNAVKQFLLQNTDIEYIQFSLGGNDFLGNWNKNMDSIQVFNLIQQVYVSIKNGIDSLNKYKPGVKILFSGYDYPNFSETVGTLTPQALQELHPFYSLWNGMGQPTPIEINTITKIFTIIIEDSLSVIENVSFVNNLGLMQWHYGQNTALTVAPFGTYQEYTAPLPFGFLNYPSPLDALNFNGLDAFHLNNNAYELFIKNHFQEYYWSELRNADLTVSAIDTNYNATISENTIDKSKLSIGTSNNIENKILLTFNTDTLPNDYIKEASIFLQLKNVNGQNLISEELTIEIKENFFGSNLENEIEDLNNLNDAENIACTYGSLSQEYHWLRIDIPSNLLQHINKEGLTQFRLSYKNISETNRNINFYNNNIYLDLKFGTEPIDTNVSLISLKNEVCTIYPNPTKNFLHLITNERIQKINISDRNGKHIISKENSKFINIEHLNKGLYFIEIKTKNTTSKLTFIKE